MTAPLEMAQTSVRGLDYPAALRALPRFCDSSYGNDAADSVRFLWRGVPVHVWIDYEDPERRDVRGNARYAVSLLLPDIDVADMGFEFVDWPLLLETEDPAALLAWCAP